MVRKGINNKFIKCPAKKMSNKTRGIFKGFVKVFVDNLWIARPQKSLVVKASRQFTHMPRCVDHSSANTMRVPAGGGFLKESNTGFFN